MSDGEGGARPRCRHATRFRVIPVRHTSFALRTFDLSVISHQSSAIHQCPNPVASPPAEVATSETLLGARLSRNWRVARRSNFGSSDWMQRKNRFRDASAKPGTLKTG